MQGKWKTVIILLMACMLIAMLPLIFLKNTEFGGADGAAEEMITEINPEYEAWISPVIEPPGGETESLLFCLQAAIGAGVIGYGFGILIERNRKEKGA